MLKVTLHLCPDITSNVLIEGTNCPYNLCYRKLFRTLLVKIVYHGTESIAYLGPKIQYIVPDKVKKKPSLSNFRKSKHNKQICLPQNADFKKTVSKTADFIFTGAYFHIFHLKMYVEVCRLTLFCRRSKKEKKSFLKVGVSPSKRILLFA